VAPHRGLGQARRSCAASICRRAGKVYLEGRLQTRQWDDRDGNKKFTTEVVAREVTFLGAAARGDAARAAEGGGAEKPAAAGSDEPGFDYGPPADVRRRCAILGTRSPSTSVSSHAGAAET